MNNATYKAVKLAAVLLSLFGFFTGKSQTTEKITIGHIEHLYSRVLKEDRPLWIYNPAQASGGNKERLPVVYLLDAEDHFYTTVGMIRQMTGRWPAMMVVGIVNTNRDRDLMPAAGNNDVGGGNRFLQFLEKELLPHIDSAYPAAPYRIFSGHSLGGLTVVNTLLKRPHLFNAYIAIDPSLWWNHEQLVGDAKAFFTTQSLDGLSLFVGRSNNMPPGMDTLAALRDSSDFTQLYRAVTKFISVVAHAPNTGLNWRSKFYPEEIHGTVELNGQYDALKFLFNYFQFNTSVFDLHTELNIDSAVNAHFKNISRRLGYTVLPSESLINNLGYTCMAAKKWDQAARFFTLNITNYPLDANCYDSMGDYYSAIGDNKKAIANYEKALTLGQDPGTKWKLDDLRKK